MFGHIVPHHLVDDLAVAHSEAIYVANVLIRRAVHLLALQRAEAKDDGAVGCLNLVKTLKCFPGVLLAALLERDELLRRGEAMPAHEDGVEARAQHGPRGIEIARFHGAQVAKNKLGSSTLRRFIAARRRVGRNGTVAGAKTVLAHIVPHHLADELPVLHAKAIDKADIAVVRLHIDFFAVERAPDVNDGAVGRLGLIETIDGFEGRALATFAISNQPFEAVEMAVARKNHVEARRQHRFGGIEVTRLHRP